jgi:hypothetical protein
VRSVLNENGIEISILSPLLHCRLSVTYVPGFASSFCAVPFTRTV